MKKKHRAHVAVVDEDVFATTFPMSVRDLQDHFKLMAQKTLHPRKSEAVCVCFFSFRRCKVRENKKCVCFSKTHKNVLVKQHFVKSVVLG